MSRPRFNTSPDDRTRVGDIVETLEAAFRFVKGRDRSDLDNDEMLLFALVRAVEIAGEAANQMNPAAHAEIPDVPWRAMIGMRHRLAHGYSGIDSDILWTTVTEAAPPIARRLREWLAENLRQLPST